MLVDIDHPRDGDVVVTLSPPFGQPRTLTNGNGGSGSGYVGTLFDNGCAVNVQAGAARHFLKRDVWMMTGTTDTSEEIPIEDGDPLIIDATLGYVGIGTPAGYTAPGKMTKLEPFDGKAPHIDGQAWKESFPVNQNPEAVTVLFGIPS